VQKGRKGRVRAVRAFREGGRKGVRLEGTEQLGKRKKVCLEETVFVHRL